ncbi:MAG TPA: BlaI/MecI/CopY family transcriptional regulator [Longimicrobiaceae bacterium]|nr:BlaI/MecI/CopY family transcriptional regulator [Longimicrobiaceae bacterium]
MGEIDGLTDLQLGVVRVLWEAGEATAAEVRCALAPERRLAPTTVATLLARLERKGLVAHRAEGRQYVFRAAVSEAEVRRASVEGVVRRFFGGDPEALARYLSDGGGAAGEGRSGEG